MAGALTANAVTARVAHGLGTGDPVANADIASLAPVEGANNVLLTGIVALTEGADVDSITFQWYRCSLGTEVEGDVLGDAVGDPFVIDTGDSELVNAPVVIQAIDRGPGLTSAYALTALSADGVAPDAEAIYADAVLYD